MHGRSTGSLHGVQAAHVCRAWHTYRYGGSVKTSSLAASYFDTMCTNQTPVQEHPARKETPGFCAIGAMYSRLVLWTGSASPCKHFIPIYLLIYNLHFHYIMPCIIVVQWMPNAIVFAIQ